VPSQPRYVRFFDELSLGDVALVGGKNASLGEMYQELMPQGVPVPNGFATTAQAYWDVLDRAGGRAALKQILDGFRAGDVADLTRRGQAARDLVYGAGLPDELTREILSAYGKLVDQYGADVSVAVRSSATAEDLPTASFAGQQDTYLNVRGETMLLDSVRRCLASLFTDRAIHYRLDQGFDHLQVALSVGVMKMVRSDMATSGVTFTLDTETGFRDIVLITAAYGLGENVVQGTVDPDELVVHKPTFELGHRAVLRRNLGTKKLKMIYATGRTREPVRNIPTSKDERDRFCISDPEALMLAEYAIQIERHYSKKAGHSMPMDIEWAKDGIDGTLYILQARPETVASRAASTTLRNYRLVEKGEVKVTGRAVGDAIASGAVQIIRNADELHDFTPGAVLVSDTTAPDWEPVMKTAAAIVTNRGGRTCHAAIVARELGIPAVVGTAVATERLVDGNPTTVSCAEGEIGRVYAGTLRHEVDETDLSQLERTRTKIMINLGNPEIAFKTSFIPNDGVGLARMEFIISEYIKVHPMALVHLDRVEDPAERAEIVSLTRRSASPEVFFIERLSEGVGTIAAAFWPKPVIVRLSDFKTNEYAHLIGGRSFEPEEANPMIGFRGAARYAHPAYAEGFALECRAMKRVREEMGLVNVKLMIPFCRRVEEGKTVLDEMAKHGLVRGEHDLEVYVMCEIPNNVIQIDAFAALFDGFSIGSNDLTQLHLGVDRDSAIVAFDFDERDPGVLEMLRLAVEGAKRNNRHSGICGQAPSDYPEVAEFLVKQGIDSISLTPDSVLRTTKRIVGLEKKLTPGE
jgi:pyruvate,water dikinase